MQEYEYLVIPVEVDDTTGRLEKLNDSMNEYGEAGWELVCIAPISSGQPLRQAFYYKKPKK